MAPTASARASARPPSTLRRARSASFSARKSRRDEEDVARSSPIRSVSSLNAHTSSATSRPPPSAGSGGSVDDGAGGEDEAAAAANAAVAGKRRRCRRGEPQRARARGYGRPPAGTVAAVAVAIPADGLGELLRGGNVGWLFIWNPERCQTANWLGLCHVSISLQAGGFLTSSWKSRTAGEKTIEKATD